MERSIVKRLGLAIAAAAAILVALYLLAAAAFPYMLAAGESGSSNYLREHRAETIMQLLGAALLLWFAWYCIRHSLAGRTWLVIAGLVACAAIVQSARAYREVPEGVRLVGGNWYVIVHHEPAEIDTVYYNLYYKHAGHYQPVHDLVSEFHFVRPDCLTFRGLIASNRPIYAMCGYRSPAGTYDTSIAEAALLQRARTQPRFRADWESAVQQQDYARPRNLR